MASEPFFIGQPGEGAARVRGYPPVSGSTKQGGTTVEKELDQVLAQENESDTGEFEKSREEYYQSMAARARGDEDASEEDESVLDEFFGEERDEQPESEKVPDVEETPLQTPEQSQSVETPPVAQKPPLMKLKVDGQEISIHDYNDAVMLAQKGLHYTQQMQALAPYRHVLKALESNPDLQEELLNRIRGGQPAKKEEKAAPVAEPEKKIEIPPMREDETYEEWTQRVFKEEIPNLVRSEAERIAGAKAAEIFKTENATLEEVRRREKILDAARADPLFNQTAYFIRQSIEAGQIPPTVLQAADSDPKTFAWLYDSARKKVASMMAPVQTAPLPAVAPSAPVETPRSPQPRAPHAEAASGRARPSKGSRDYVKVIEDMEDAKFKELLERVKAGGAR